MAACTNNILGSRDPNALEVIAQTEMESIYGRVLSETEWQRVRTPLREFAGLLQSWELNGRKNAPVAEIISFPEGGKL
jgi:hypothetical protein